MRIIVLLPFFSFFLSSCYLFDPNIEVQFINNTDRTFTSISWTESEDTDFGANILEADLIPGTTHKHIFPPGSYLFRFETDESLPVLSDEIILMDIDIYEYTINE